MYNEIIEESGRGQIISGLLDKVCGVAGTAVLFFTLGIMVWDIYSSAHPLDTAAKDAAMAAASVDPAAIMQVVEAVAATLTEEAEISTVFVAMAGMLSGIAEQLTLSPARWCISYLHLEARSPPTTLRTRIAMFPKCLMARVWPVRLLITTSNELGPVINPFMSRACSLCKVGDLVS